MRRFAANFALLSPACRARLTGGARRGVGAAAAVPCMAGQQWQLGRRNGAGPAQHSRARLSSPAAVENDDVASAFSLQDLLFLHSLTGVPLVFGGCRGLGGTGTRACALLQAGLLLRRPARRCLTALLPPLLPAPLCARLPPPQGL